jgi:mRNA-degrading endonuclease RelE of RelBE toxin-antitoxin system
MTYKIAYHPQVAKKDIPSLGSAKSRVKSAIEDKLSKSPLRFGKPLQYSLKSYRSFRVGKIRVIFDISEDTIHVIKIGVRSDVYEDAVSRIFTLNPNLT